ncbi:cysteine-rich venom protein-like [Podarcis muralis]
MRRSHEGLFLTQHCQLAAVPVPGILCGESLSRSNFVRPWRDVIKNWYSSVATFKYGHKEFGKGHDFLGYTQMVWYNSHEVGCTFVHCPQLESPYLYMCPFCPLGSIVKQLRDPYRPGPPCGDCPQNCEDKLCTNPCQYVDKIKECDVLLQMGKCTDELLGGNCQATCKCKTEIK